jgi:thiol-disulfide isomerase/thioredoxin
MSPGSRNLRKNFHVTAYLFCLYVFVVVNYVWDKVDWNGPRAKMASLPHRGKTFVQGVCMQIYLASFLLILGVMTPQTEDAKDIERRIITYVKENLEPGKPLVVSKLYNEVFTSPEERKVLGKLNGVFFRIPLFIIEHQVTQERLPTLGEIADQFDFYGPEESDVVLTIMESDPRVPKFIKRDPGTGELVEIDVEKVKADPRFNQAIERIISGWEGKPAPDIGGTSFDGTEIRLSTLEGQAVLLYVWFTNCPPCARIAPELAAIHKKYSNREFTVVGANADRVLDLPYDDSTRAEYLDKHAITFPNIHLTKEARESLGNVNIFPTLFLIDREGNITKYYVNYQSRDVLEKEIEKIIGG